MNKVILFLLVSSTFFAQQKIYVKDYKAIANDGIDDTEQINKAFKNLKDGDIIVFEPGIYTLKPVANGGNYHLLIKNTNNITLLGAVDSDNNPLTHFQRTLVLEKKAKRPPLLSSKNNSNLLVKNITFDNAPHHTTAGEIIEVDKNGKFLKVKIFEGLPFNDNTPFTAANVWNPETKNLKEVPSLSFGTSPANMITDDADQRIMKIEHKDGLSFLQYVKKGELLSWHYGWKASTMVSFRDDSNLTLDNIHIYNALRSALFIAYTTNVTIKNVSIKPKGNQLAMGPRDGIHSSRIKGNYIVENLTVEGCRLDAFVARGTFADVFEVTSKKTLKIRTDRPLSKGFSYDSSLPIEFIDKNGNHISLDVKNALFVGKSKNPSAYLYEIKTSNKLPDFVKKGTEVIPRGLSVRSLILKNNRYKNIAGSSEILYVDNVTSINNTHEKIMYSAIKMGSNLSAGHTGSNFKILNSTFKDCGWISNSANVGYIYTKNNHRTYPNSKIIDVTIKNNTFTSNSFETSKAVLSFNDLNKSLIDKNTFQGFLQPLLIDEVSTQNIEINDNKNYPIGDKKEVKLSVTKDAYVTGGDFQNKNYGNHKKLQIKNSSTPNHNRISYIQFNLSSLKNKEIKNVILSIFLEEKQNKDGVIHLKSSNGNWVESSINFANKPNSSKEITTLKIKASSKKWYKIDITEFIKNNYKENPIINFSIEQDKNYSNLISAYSKESGSFKIPYLNIKL